MQIFHYYNFFFCIPDSETADPIGKQLVFQYVNMHGIAVVAQWVRALAPQTDGWCSNPSRDRPKS